MLKRLKVCIKKNYFSLILTLYSLYSFIAIFRSSFIINGTRFFSLFDDEMISMRYAKNFAHGFGLIWNPGGDSVQGFTNLLWTLYMAMVHIFPIPLSKTSFVIQVTSLLCMLISLIYIKKIAGVVSENSEFVIFLSVLFSAFYYPLINWTVILGTEVSILTLLLTLSVYKAIEIIKTRKFSVVPFILLGIGILVRLDFFLPSVVLTLLLVFLDIKNWKKHIFIGAPIFLIFMIGVLLFQLSYYHNILPNTYYLKLTGYPIFYRVTRGIYVTAQSINWPIFIIPFIYLYISKNKWMLLLLAPYVALLFYSVYIGGDIWELFGGPNRFVAFAMPLFFISLFVSLSDFRQLMRIKYKNLHKKYKLIEICTIFMFFIVINSGSNNMLSQLFFLGKPFYMNEVTQRQTLQAFRLFKNTRPSAKIAIVAAGIVPYFTDRYFVDILGVNEKTIAREQAKYEESSDIYIKLVSYVPGHMKWDYPYTLQKYKPDLFVFSQSYEPSEVEKKNIFKNYVPVITPEADIFYIDRNSKNIILTDLQTTEN